MNAPVTRSDRLATVSALGLQFVVLSPWIETGAGIVSAATDALAQAFANHREKHVGEERAAVVDYLRVVTNGAGEKPRILDSVAKDIERGEHAKEVR